MGSGQIAPEPFDLQFPGDPQEPGNRSLPDQVHVGSAGTGVDSGYGTTTADTTTGIPTYYYNFKDVYGTDSQGNPLHNLIRNSADEEQCVREVFQLFSEYAGVQFVESPSQGFTIAVGDLSAVGGTSGVGGDTFIADPAENLLVLDNADVQTWGPSQFGGTFFTTAMQGLGLMLGLGNTYDLPPNTVMGNDPNQGTGEGIYPGLDDLVQLQRVYRPASMDIDLYQFNVTTAGTFNAETVAQRLSNASPLNSELTLFQQNADGTGTVIARNDDYFGTDSYLTMTLQPGTYYIGVTSTGNDQYDPSIPDSGIGGTTQGPYKLDLQFTPQNATELLSASGVPFDGDSDGSPGGVYNFWFNAVATTSTTNKTIFVDKIAAAGGNGTIGALTTPFRRRWGLRNRATSCGSWATTRPTTIPPTAPRCRTTGPTKSAPTFTTTTSRWPTARR